MTEETKKTPEEDAAAAKLAESAKNDTKDGDGGQKTQTEADIIADLNKKLEEAKRRADLNARERDAERVQKDSARKDALTAAEQRVKAEEDRIKSDIQAAKSSLEAAEKDYDDAFDSGDKAKTREAIKKLNDAQAMMRGAEFRDKSFKEWQEINKNKSDASKETAPRFTPKEQAWIDKNPRFNDDPDFKDCVVAADAVARNRGIEIDSDAYFDLIESRLKKEGFKSDDGKDGARTDNKASDSGRKSSNASSTAAPPGGTSGGNNSRSNGVDKTITMTPDMRRAAQITFPDEYKKDPKAAEEKYAKYRMQAEEQDKAKGRK